MIATVTSKGQVTLPAEARRLLGINAGTKLDFIVRDSSRLEVIRIDGSVRDLKGVLSMPRRTLTLSEMDDAIAEGAIR